MVSHTSAQPNRRTRPAMLLRAVLFLLSATVAVFTGNLPVAAKTQRVVLLFDERVELPGLSMLEAEFSQTLQVDSENNIEIYREAMELSRFGSDDYKAALRDFLRLKYANKKIDVAVAVMAPARDFLSRFGEEIFPKTPIVFCGLDRKQLGNEPVPSNQYGILVKREFAPTLDLAPRIHPKTREVVVVSGTSAFDDTILEQARLEFRSYESRVAITYLSELSVQSLLTSLSTLSPDNVVFFTTFFQDGVGEPFVPHEAVRRISDAASVPLYGFIDQYLGRGIVGGNRY